MEGDTGHIKITRKKNFSDSTTLLCVILSLNFIICISKWLK